MMSLPCERRSEQHKPSRNGLQSAHNNQAPPTAPSQRIGKRRYSMGVGFKGLFKRRRRANSDSQSEPVLPSNFLLGGNIFDPLNLNSLLDEEVNRSTNQETPKCSPLPARGGDPVEILVPRDITDPLSLKVGGAILLSPLKNRKRRSRHHAVAVDTHKEGKTDRPFLPTGSAVPLLTRGGSVPPSPLPCELNTTINCRDDVVPPPILPRRHTHPPLSHAHKARNQGDSRQRRRRRTTSVRSSESATIPDLKPVVTQASRFQTPLVGGAKASRCASLPTRKKEKDKRRYQHGNHSHYYGYHGFYGDRWEGRVGAGEDPRLRLLKADWFKDKHVLDIGCGTGHVTLAIAKQFGPKHILGVDRDKRLVHAAKQNIRHFLSHDVVVAGREKQLSSLSSLPPSSLSSLPLSSLSSLPLSFRVCRGPLAPPPLHLHTTGFPSNVTFITGDYVTPQEAWPGQGVYDVILCLGVTKWVQLQSGDTGVVRLFKRAYQSLSPGGMFILEPHPWSSYSHNKRTTETTYQNYRSLRLRPEDFTSHLTEHTGFTSYRLLTHSGVQRPVYLFHKSPAPRK